MAGDHIAATGHRFQRDNPKGFIETGEDRGVDDLVDAIALAVADKAEEIDRMFHAQFIGQRPHLLPILAGNQQARFGVHSENARQGTNQHMHPFFMHHASHKKEQPFAMRGITCLQSI